jgi:flagellar hook protein FlgE
MDFGLGAAQSALSAQSDALSAWGDDLANAQTPGFQGDVPTFALALDQNLPRGAWATPLTGAATPTRSVGSGSVAVFQEDQGGAVTATGRALDVAVNGPGYLVVDNAGQRRFTRDGSLSVDGAGYLVDAAGGRVLSAAGQPIQLPVGAAVEIQNGRVVAAGRPVAALAVAQVANPGGLVRVGGSELAATAAAGAVRVAAAAPGQLMTGYLNLSSTSMAQAMAGLVSAQTGFELAAKVAQQAAQLASLTAQIPG